MIEFAPIGQVFKNWLFGAYSKIKQNNLEKFRSPIWEKPWGYLESVILILTFWLISIVITWAHPISLKSLSFDHHLVILGLIGLSGLINFLFFKKAVWHAWLVSLELTIVNLLAGLFLVFLMLIFEQNSFFQSAWIKTLQLDNISSSLYVWVLAVLVELQLSTVIWKRIFNFTKKDFVFVLQHTGILLVIAALWLGASDVEKHTVKVEKAFAPFIINRHAENFEMVQMRLVDFDLTYFPPKLAIVHVKDTLQGIDLKWVWSIESKTSMRFKNHQIEVDTLLVPAIPIEGNYYRVNDLGHTQAVRLNLSSSQQKRQAWVSNGSLLYPSVMASLDDQYAVAMLKSEPKTYQCLLEIEYPNGQIASKLSIEVNRPIQLGMWTVYLTDFNAQWGDRTDYVILEMVYDPWLEIMYIGLGLLVIGSISMLLWRA